MGVETVEIPDIRGTADRPWSSPPVVLGITIPLALVVYPVLPGLPELCKWRATLLAPDAGVALTPVEPLIIKALLVTSFPVWPTGATVTIGAVAVGVGVTVAVGVGVAVTVGDVLVLVLPTLMGIAQLINPIRASSITGIIVFMILSLGIYALLKYIASFNNCK
jgi:hypothetical protein